VGVLQRFERRLAELVDGAFAKAFKADVQPVEIASALQRECNDRAAIIGRGRTMVPNDFTIQLGESDHERLSTFTETLSAELGELVREYAREQGYTFIGPVEIRFEHADELDTGMFRIRSQALAGVMPQAQADAAPAHHAKAWLEINRAKHPLTKPVTVLGRGSDVDLRIDDPSISRHHAEISLQSHHDSTATIVDLGSTNGVTVDDHPVRQALLADGSVILLGGTTLVFRWEEA